MKNLFDFNKTRIVVKNRDTLLKRASEEEKTLSAVIASDYSESFHLNEEDGLKLVEDMNACAAEYRTECIKAETKLPEEYLQEKIDAVKADESSTLYQKYCVLSGIFELLNSANHAAAKGTDITEALEQAKQNIVLKPEEEVLEGDLDSLAELIISTGSICLLTVPEEYRKAVASAINDDSFEAVPEFDKTDLTLLDAYCIYKAIKTGKLIPEPEWKDADSLVLLRALVFRATAEQDVESIIREVADGKMTWEKAEEIIKRISFVLLCGLTISVLILAAAGSAAAFISLTYVLNIGMVLLLFGSLTAALYVMYRGFDYIEAWMKEVAAPALASASIRAAKKANELAKEGRQAFESWNEKRKEQAEAKKAAKQTHPEDLKAEVQKAENTDESITEPEVLTNDTEGKEVDFA